jgi:DNA-binding beta-propeller fold protein YncE
MALDGRARRLVVADPEADVLVAVDAETLAVQHRWRAPGGPQLPLVSPDGIICVTGHVTGTLTIVRPQAGGFAEQTIDVGPGPHDPAVSADGAAVFVPCMGGHEIVKVALADGRILGRTRVGHGPSHAKTDAARRRVYIANSWDGTVAAMSEDGEMLASAPSGGWAHAIEVTPDGRWVLVANFLDDTVTVFAADTLTRVALLETEPYPHGLDVARDGRRVVVTGFAADHARVFEIGTWRLLARPAVGRGGSHTAFVPGGDLALVACSVDDHLACVDLGVGNVTERVTIQ